jgi:DNA primase
MYQGMLSIPYVRQAGNGKRAVVSIRFRCLEDHEHHGHGKYNTEAGDRPRLYNTLALIESDKEIAVCEGELDAVVAEQCGVPAVGVPGVQSWRPWFRDPFLGYERVWLLADGDDPGRMFAKTLAQTLTNSKIIPMPQGYDVNSFVLAEGPDALKEKLV